ncbi:V4R domain-containing protein [Acaryochloris sp. IP29b_bin.148]|uniref:V4R domain-containing protein n=1 Tax=Acaryochloris sp. IP29b_bin.148 TaxID=2969218 RepID=UPI00261C5D9E|nr:V4R domain-containing protein [Acaryochloris sp. IP29b_bin.148]
MIHAKLKSPLNEFTLPQTDKASIDLLPPIATIQRCFSVDSEASHQNWEIPTNPLNMLNNVVRHFPAQEIYQIGRELGEREFKAFYLACESGSFCLLDLDWREILEMWWAHAYLSEYGNVNLALSQAQRDYFFVTFTNTKIHRTKETKHKPVCPLIAGVLAGFFSRLSGQEYEAIETECHEQGHQNCTFILGHSGLVNSATFWQTIHDIH